MIFGIDITYITVRHLIAPYIDKTDSAREYRSFVKWESTLYARLNG